MPIVKLLLPSHCSTSVSFFFFSGLSCNIPYSLCALCVDILEVYFHSPSAARQKGKSPRTSHSLQNKSRNADESSEILQSSSSAHLMWKVTQSCP